MSETFEPVTYQDLIREIEWMTVERARLRKALEDIRAAGTWTPAIGDPVKGVMWKGEPRMNGFAQIADTALETKEP